MSMKGHKHTEEWKKKASLRMAGNKYALGFIPSKETREKLSRVHMGNIPWNKGIKWENRNFKHSEETKLKMSSIKLNLFKNPENHPLWLSDRSLLKPYGKRANDSSYKKWSRNVKKRDGKKCFINNTECSGNIEAHHILGWADYPELRYDINNGITVCHFHHPKKRIDEKRLIPTFQELVLIRQNI